MRTKHKEYLSLVIAVLLLEAILLILIQLHEKPISNSGVTILCLCPYLLIRFVTFILNIGKMAKLMVMSLVVGIEVFTVSVFLSGLNADNLLLACAVFLYCVFALQQNSRKDSKWLWGRVILCFLLLVVGVSVVFFEEYYLVALAACGLIVNIIYCVKNKVQKNND